MINTIILIITGIVLFNFVIFVHECGHFIPAKIFGVKVEEFALGMGFTVWKFKKGETVYSLRLFPIGGFCEMGEDDEDTKSEGTFGSKKAWQRIIIIAGGATMNLVLGFFMIMFVLSGNEKFASTTIKEFSNDSVSYASGLRENDQVLSVDGFRVNTYNDLNFALFSDTKKQTFNLEVKRNNEKIKIENYKYGIIKLGEGDKVDFNVAPIEKNFWTLISQSYLNTISMVKITWSGLIGIATGRFSFKQMQGPIGMAASIGKSASVALKTGLWTAIQNIIMFMAIISVNLGVVNLLPLPALDGGRLFFLLIELITRKKLNPKYEGWIHAAGFCLLIALMIWIAYQDIIRIIFGA